MFARNSRCAWAPLQQDATRRSAHNQDDGCVNVHANEESVA